MDFEIIDGVRHLPWFGRVDAPVRGGVRLLAECPFCSCDLTVLKLKATGVHKRTCKCGAVLGRDFIARKPVQP